MRLSKYFLPTLRQAPNDAEVISHKLLSRAGFIRKVAMGIYDFLPLAVRSLDKISRIVREEMNQAGAQEITMPHAIPAELWMESGRWQKYGKELLRLTDRHDREYCFGPTHEEVVCDIVRQDVRSYKQLPLHLYQIQTKFRDEIRPRFGLMRGREFIMKDGYSFHATDDDLDREYRVMHQTYQNIFRRCGLESRAVQADTGAIGGNFSHEFMVLAATGEDTIASCSTCDYAANLEKATFAWTPPENKNGESTIQEVHTPKKKNIADQAKELGIDVSDLLKMVLYKADDVFVVAAVRGNREVNEVKLKNKIGATELRLATDEEVIQSTGVIPGFLGPKNWPKPEIKIYYDISLQGLAGLATGANKKDFHITGLSMIRDLNIENFFDISSVIPGDHCPACKSGNLEFHRGIEVGHIFKLGKKYSEAMKLSVLDETGKESIVTMGCYGIGVSRVLAACVEQNHDDFGIKWPRALAPFEIEIITMGPEENIAAAGLKIHDELIQSGLDVLWDDRDERAGVKFNDADLIGIPLQILIGKKGLEKGEFEFKIRKTGEKGSFAAANAAVAIRELLSRVP